QAPALVLYRDRDSARDRTWRAGGAPPVRAPARDHVVLRSPLAPPGARLAWRRPGHRAPGCDHARLAAAGNGPVPRRSPWPAGPRGYGVRPRGARRREPPLSVASDRHRPTPLRHG